MDLQKKTIYKICSFTQWNPKECERVVSMIKFDAIKKQSWHNLVEIMLSSKSDPKLAPSLSSDLLYHHMNDTWMEFDKQQKNSSVEQSGQKFDSSSAQIVYDTADRVYQDFVNDRFRFFSKKQLFHFNEIGNYSSISRRSFDKLSQIIECNLASLYARDTILSFLDEYCCYSDDLAGLLPSINLHNSFVSFANDDNLVQFLEVIFEEEKFARIAILEKALQKEIEAELNVFDVVCEPTNTTDCHMINALMKTVLQRLLQYFNAVYPMHSKRDTDGGTTGASGTEHDEVDDDDVAFNLGAGNEFNIEFALWIVSIFVKILSDKVHLSTNKKQNYAAILFLKKQKMLKLVFTRCLMSLLFDCIVICPASFGSKVAVLVQQIIEQYPKRNPLERLEHVLYDTIQSFGSNNTNSAYNDNDKDNENENDEENISLENQYRKHYANKWKRLCYPELHVNVKHLVVIGQVIEDLHSSMEDGTMDVLVSLIELMLSVISCNYHYGLDHSSGNSGGRNRFDLHSLLWFQSVLKTYQSSKWFAIKDPQLRTANTMQFLMPDFYSELYATVSQWNQFGGPTDERKRDLISLNILMVHSNLLSEILLKFQSLLALPDYLLATQATLEEFLLNFNEFVKIVFHLDFDPEKHDQIKQLALTHEKVSKMNASMNDTNVNKDAPDWFILQQMKQLGIKISSVLSFLHEFHFANPHCDTIDAAISELGKEYDSVMTTVINKAMKHHEVQSVTEAHTFSFESHTVSSENMLWLGQDLTCLSSTTINVRLQSIFQLNVLINKNFQFIDISKVHKIKSSFGNLLCSLNQSVIMEIVSLNILDLALTSSADGAANEPSFQVDRFRCKSDAPDDVEYLMFTECMKQFSTFKAETFRLEPHAKAWKCQFAKEHATDAGGPYRESIEWMCNELENDSNLGLFMLCPNAQHEQGRLNRDKNVFAPIKCSAEHERMYIFLGKLMGLAMRTKELLSLNLCSAMWKRIANAPLTVSDIIEMDASAFSILEHLNPFIAILENENNINNNESKANNSNNNNSNDTNADLFCQELQTQIQIFNALMSRISAKFVAKSSDGSTYPLVADGDLIAITHKNVSQFESAYVLFRVQEYDFAADAIRRGLSTVIPIHLVNLLSIETFENLICGKPTIDIELFQKMTSYSNCGADDPTIQLFWEMIKNKMNHQERCKLLQFIWGRSRLPDREQDFDKKMSIILLDHGPNDNPNNFLPVTHTCFFQLDLPRYTDINAMYAKISYAITHCGSIDTDE